MKLTPWGRSYVQLQKGTIFLRVTSQGVASLLLLGTCEATCLPSRPPRPPGPVAAPQEAPAAERDASPPPAVGWGLDVGADSLRNPLVPAAPPSALYIITRGGAGGQRLWATQGGVLPPFRPGTGLSHLHPAQPALCVGVAPSQASEATPPSPGAPWPPPPATGSGRSL